MLSPSFETGLDLPGMLRFQIIPKTPFGQLLDKRTQLRLKSKPEYYIMDAVMRLVQAYGRGVRSMTDVCTTYILDSDFSMLANRGGSYFPRWFKEAVISK